MNNKELMLLPLQQMQGQMTAMQQRMDGMGARMDTMQGQLDRVEKEARSARILAEENGHKIQLVAEQYTDIATKLERVDQLCSLRDRVQVLERVVMDLNARVPERAYEGTQQSTVSHTCPGRFAPAGAFFCFQGNRRRGDTNLTSRYGRVTAQEIPTQPNRNPNPN